MGSILDIINGHINEALSNNEDLFEKRLNICKECPLYKDTALGPICNPKLYIDKNNNTSTSKRDGYVKGCGCRLNAKTRLTYSKCVINKW